jgi:hypothetical protein
VFASWGVDVLGLNSYQGAMCLMSIIITPLILLRSYGELTAISVASLGFIVCIVMFVLVQGQIESDSFKIAQFYPSSIFDSIEVIGTFAYAASVQMVMFEAYLSTKDQEKEKFLKV